VQTQSLGISLGSGVSPEVSPEVSPGGSPGSLKIQENGSLEGSPSIGLEMDDKIVATLKTLAVGKSLESKYLFPAASASLENFKPSLLSRFGFVEDNGVKERSLEASEATSLLGVEFSFGEEDGEPDYTVLRVLRREPREISREVVDAATGEESSSRRKAMETVFDALVSRSAPARRAIESEDREGIRKIYRQHNPDSRIASQTKAMTFSVQSSAAAVADRMVSPLESPLSDAHSLMLAARDSRLAYGLLRAKSMKEDSLPSRLWFQYIRSFGRQQLEEDTKTSGDGFLVGLDHRFQSSMRLGLAFTLGRDSAKSDSRERDLTTRAVSLYGEYGKKFYLALLATYGWTESRDNDLKAKGSIVYLNPTLGVRLPLVRRTNLKITLRPELGARYFRVQLGEQRDDLGIKVGEMDRDSLAPMLGLRLGALCGKKFALGGRLGLSYSVQDSGDKFYLVTMPSGQSYQLVDETREKELDKFTAEAGFSVGYKLTKAIEISLNYSGRYASSLVGHSLALEAGLEF
jgi:outer membrane autotransporter protein